MALHNLHYFGDYELRLKQLSPARLMSLNSKFFENLGVASNEECFAAKPQQAKENKKSSFERLANQMKMKIY
jgi:hypothetical protein